MSRSKDDFWDSAFDMVSAYIEKKADDSDLRELYFKMMSDRRWKNNAMNDLIDGIVAAESNIVDMYLDDRTSERDAMREAVRDIVDGHFAAVIINDRKLSRELSDRTYDQMREASEKFEDIMDNRSRRGSGSSRRRDDLDDRDRRDDRRDREYGGRDRDRDDRRDSGGRSYGERRSSPSRGSSSNSDDPWSLLSQVESGFREEAEHVNDDGSRERMERVRPEPVEVEREEPVVARRRSNVEGPDFTRADPFGEYWLRGEHWVVAHRSRWELDDPSLSADAGELIPRWHDLNLYVKYFVKNADGFVREELVEVSDDNRYLNQELRVQRGEEPEERRSSAISLRALRKTTSEEDILDTPQPAVKQRTVDLIEKLNEVADLVPEMTEGAPVDSLVAATFSGRSKMLSTEREADLLLGYMRTPLAASSWEQMDLIDQVGEAPSLVAAAELMNELKPKFDLSIWNKLNERFTTLALRAMHFQFHFTAVKQMNFARDIGVVMKAMAKQRDDEFASMFGGRTRYINQQATQYASKEDLAATVADLGVDAEKFPAIVFLDFMEIVSINATLDELGISNLATDGAGDKGLSISNAGNRQLASALRRIFEAVKGSLPGVNARVLLSTADNFLIEVTPYAARNEAFVFSLVK